MDILPISCEQSKTLKWGIKIAFCQVVNISVELIKNPEKECTYRGMIFFLKKKCILELAKIQIVRIPKMQARMVLSCPFIVAM